MSANPDSLRGESPHAFVSNVAEIRRRVRDDMQQLCAAADLAHDPDVIVRLLNAALATELACVQRYQRYALMDGKLVADALKHDFRRRAQEERAHAERIAARITALGGQPLPEALPPSAAGYWPEDEPEALSDMLAEDLISERIAMDTYREIMSFLGERDVATRDLFQALLIAEREHQAELAILRDSLSGLVRGAGLRN